MLAYLLLRDNIQSGPYSLDELKVTGILATDLLWIEGRSTAWRYADEIEELQAFVDAALSINGASVPTNALQMHHEEDEGNKSTKGNRAGISPSLSTEIKKEEKDKAVEHKPDAGEIPRTVSRRSLEIRKSLLSKKEPSPPPLSESEKQDSNAGNEATAHVIKVIIADDHTLFREGVKIALSQKKDIQIIGEAENGAQLLNQLRHNRPDVILLDIQMPVMDGISALASIRKLYGDMKVIMLSMHEGHSMVSTLMETGANAYLTKTADPETIYQAIKTCYAKEFYFNELTNVSMLEGLRSKKRIPEKIISPAFDGANLMLRLTAAQKKSARHSPEKIKKRILIASFSVLLIGSGIVAGLSVLSHPKQIKPLYSAPARQAANNQPKVSIHHTAVPPSQRKDSVQKQADDDILLLEKNDILQDEKKEIVAKRKRAKTTDSFKSSSPQVVRKIDSILNTNNAVDAKQASSPMPDVKAIARNSVRSLVTVSANDYHKGLFGGLSDIELTVNNRSAYIMDEVVVEIKYLLTGSKLYKTETLNFEGIAPSSNLLMEAPKSSRGVKVEYRIMSIKSKELGL